eukprot:5564585-Lingulodinium_polyedra.AAC.1
MNSRAGTRRRRGRRPPPPRARGGALSLLAVLGARVGNTADLALDVDDVARVLGAHWAIALPL